MQPTTAKFGAFTVEIGDGASPEVFAAPCGFTSKALTLSKSLAEVAIPDCDDPDAPFYIARDVQTQSWNVSGQGLLAGESVEVWLEAFQSTESVSVQVEVTMGAATLTLTGKAHLESWELGAEQGGRVTCNVTLQSDGAPVIAYDDGV